MPGNTVKLTQTVDDRDVVQALERQLKLIDRIERRLDDTGKTGQKSGERTTTSWLNTNRTLQIVGQAAQAVIQQLEKTLELQHRIRMQAAGSAESIDSAVRSFLIQQGPAGLSADQTRQAATRIGTQAGVSQQSVLRIAKQLASTGFGDPLSEGGSAEAVIAFLQSTAQDPEQADLEGVVSAFAQQLQASRQQLTGQNLLKLAVQTRGLFASTPLEAPDLIAFAQARGVATQVGVNQEDFLAASAVVKEQLSAEQGSTGLGNFITKLAAPKAGQLSALKALGVSPGDVDFSGESLPQVAGRLAEAVDRLAPEQQTRAIGELFGAEKSQLTAAFALLQAARTGKFEQFAGFTRDTAGFEFGVEQARTSEAAARQRLLTQQAEESALLTEARGASETQLQEAQNLLDLRRKRVREEGGGSLAGDVLDSFGRVPGDFVGSERDVAAQARTRGAGFSLEQLQMQENNQKLSEINQGIQRLNRNGPPERDLGRRD